MEIDTLNFDWTEDEMLWVTLPKAPDGSESASFLKVRETLSRIGMASRNQNELTQTCHILHKRGKYYIMHFKELFLLDGKSSTLTVGDIHRRDVIATLLDQWGLVKIVDCNKIAFAPMMRKELGRLTVIPYAEKHNWTIKTKYSVGKNRRRNRNVD
jgi:hypothetical protein